MFFIQQSLTASICVIDDDPAICKLLKTLLASKGHRVIIAHTGEKALEKINTKKIDIIITDVKLPGMSGRKVLEIMKSQQPGCDIIVITGYGSLNEAVEFMKAGALDYITKPLNPEHLDIVIQKALERKSLIKAAEERDYYRKISLTDGLTGLFNKNYFLNALEKEIHQSTRSNDECSIMMLDIDDFKSINDIYGHQTGDLVLRELAYRISQACRCYDTIARYGGEEFIVLLPNTSIYNAEVIARRVLRFIENNPYKGMDKKVTSSIGISTFPLHAGGKDDIIRKADIALYSSKRKGKNRYTIYKEELDCVLQ